MLLELEALLNRIEELAAAADRQRYDSDDLLRWVIQRLWTAVGNEVAADGRVGVVPDTVARPWTALVRLRNELAHRRLPDIDEDEVRRVSVLLPGPLRLQVRSLVA